jgi:hypothetical protein
MQAVPLVKTRVPLTLKMGYQIPHIMIDFSQLPIVHGNQYRDQTQGTSCAVHVGVCHFAFQGTVPERAKAVTNRRRSVRDNHDCSEQT